MRLAGLQAVRRRRGLVLTTRHGTGQGDVPDPVKRRFMAEKPNQSWMADIAYIPTKAVFIYLAVVLDVWSQ